MKQQISEPTAEDIEALGRQLVVVRNLVATHLHRKLAGDATDLDALQSLLDAGVLSPDCTYELQSLGVVFGMQLVAALEGVDWAIVDDEYGRDAVLRYLQTSLLVCPLTMISKRVEDGEPVCIVDLFDGVCAEVEKVRGEIGPN